ncbi:MAG TPA: ferritin family protein, partial [Thauera sp.]|nr:ferritin family protein [Thauera sp.]
AFDYTMNAWQALGYARENEARAMNFYRTVSDTSTDPEIKALAMEFATEEADHTMALDKMIAQTQRP